MRLLRAILTNTREPSRDKLSSPPPEIDPDIITKKRKKRINKYAHVQACVDTSPPIYCASHKLRNLETSGRLYGQLWAKNVELLMMIKKAHFNRGRVDSHWRFKLPKHKQYYRSRVDFCKRVEMENRVIFHRLKNAIPRLPTTAEYQKDWCLNCKKIVSQAACKFVLFPPEPTEDVEDPAFLAPPGVKRPRVYISLGIVDGAALGELCCELFTDVCPNTCDLFLDLLDGDTLGHGYVGTSIFRKVPELYWRGGDVIYNNGFGCYMQRGRRAPISAENYHFSHSIPGLLSMRVTRDDEVCGMFNITFKPLPQLDLRNIVFGRIIRPSTTFNSIKSLGSALNVRPVVEIRATRRKCKGRWVYGERNVRIPKFSSVRIKRIAD